MIFAVEFRENNHVSFSKHMLQLRLGNAYYVNWYIKTGCYIALFVVECEVIHHDLEINLASIHIAMQIFMRLIVAIYLDLTGCYQDANTTS